MSPASLPISESPIIIVGGGQAGAVAAAALRDAGFEGRVLLVGAEQHLPYERPPLSKDVLVKPEAARLTIHSESFYSEKRIECRFGVAAVHLDVDERQLGLASGETLPFGKLLLATGARARAYPLLDQLGAGIHTLRSLDDAEALRGHLWPGRRLLVVGGGIIGLEVAASATVMGAQVTIIERAPRLMSRGTPLPLVESLAQLHREQGVRFELGAELIEASKTKGGEIHLTAEDGRHFSGDLVVYGIGVELNVDLAVSAGLHLEDGIIVDEYGCTSHPLIYAAGDVARQWNPELGAYVRSETWGNAQNQGNGVARAMVTGQPCDFEVPWYWTDQYGSNFQVAGAIEAEEWLLRGNQTDGKYSLFGLTDGAITGAITVNNGREMRPAKALIAAKARLPDLDALRNPKQDLRKLVPAA